MRVATFASSLPISLADFLDLSELRVYLETRTLADAIPVLRFAASPQSNVSIYYSSLALVGCHGRLTVVSR